MGDMNSQVHSYCDGFQLVKNAENDWTLRMMQKGGTDSIKVMRRTGPTAQADLTEFMNLLNASMRLQGADV